MTGRTSWSSFGFFVIFTCSLVFFLFPGQRSLAGEATIKAEQAIHDLAEDIWANIGPSNAAGRIDRLAETIKARTNVDVLSRLALGRYWRRLDGTQQGDYQRLFSIVIMNTLASRLDVYVGELSGPLNQYFKITDSMRAGKRDVLVRSKVISTAGIPLAVDWRLRQFDNDPFVIDLVIEGVSLLVSQRAEFAAVIEKSRIEGLIRALEKRVPKS